jgi:hypothetical protein
MFTTATRLFPDRDDEEVVCYIYYLSFSVPFKAVLVQDHARGPVFLLVQDTPFELTFVVACTKTSQFS